MIERFSPAYLLVLGALGTAACSAPTPAGSGPLDPVVTMTILSSPGPWQGVAGYPIDEPLRVQVQTDGVPTAGVRVTWSAKGGNLVPRGTVTDEYGEAWADWRLGSSPGTYEAVAQMTEPVVRRVVFTAIGVLKVEAEAVQTEMQHTAEVGQELPLPVAVRVTQDGRPMSGVPVTWQSTGGAITPWSVTGTDGVASARWTLGTVPGAYAASARVVGDPFGPIQFLATARTGPLARVDVVSGNGQFVPPFEAGFQPMTLVARDRFGNVVSGVPVKWSIEQGTATVMERDTATKGDGRSTAHFAALEPASAPVVVRADLPNGLSALFTVNFQAHQAVIYLDPFTPRFVSGWNRSSPAVDTVAVGTTVRWQLSVFDYDDHAIEPDGIPAFSGGGYFPYARISYVDATFTTAGTYRYIDPFTGAGGTIVVR